VSGIVPERQTIGDDRVRGVQAGGDDYLTKPCAPAIHVAAEKVQGQIAEREPCRLRRPSGATDECLNARQQLREGTTPSALCSSA
jgi:DNA-binding response OmpR family regulator